MWIVLGSRHIQGRWEQRSSDCLFIEHSPKFEWTYNTLWLDARFFPLTASVEGIDSKVLRSSCMAFYAS
jgi:hypothetical protein